MSHTVAGLLSGPTVYESMLDTTLPSEDIDITHEVDHLRMERLDDDSVFVAGYTDGEDEPDYRYWLDCTDDGLKIEHEKS